MMPITARANDPAGANSQARVGEERQAEAQEAVGPIFRSTPARITLPAVGASTWASGSQVWNGNIGTLIAKASAKARNSRFCAAPARQHEAREHRQVEGVDAGGAAVLEVEGQDRHQHQERAGHRVEDELHRRVDAVAARPRPR